MSYTVDTLASPNYTPAAKCPAVFGMPRKITGITIHHWGKTGQSHDGVAGYLARPGGTSSAHLVASAGRVTRLVPDRDAAWHAGSARGNATTIGIECRPEATEADYATVAALVRDLRALHGDLPLYPHHHWKNTACPGVWDLARIDRLARTEGDDDMAGAADEILTRLARIEGVLYAGTEGTAKPLTVYGRVVDVQLALTSALPQLLTRPGVDASQVAATVVAAIPTDIAQDVIDGLGARLQAGDRS